MNGGSRRYKMMDNDMRIIAWLKMSDLLAGNHGSTLAGWAWMV
jgi:hypothetical protein